MEGSSSRGGSVNAPRRGSARGRYREQGTGSHRGGHRNEGSNSPGQVGGRQFRQNTYPRRPISYGVLLWTRTGDGDWRYFAQVSLTAARGRCDLKVDPFRGKQEAAETAFQTAARETFEESMHVFDIRDQGLRGIMDTDFPPSFDSDNTVFNIAVQFDDGGASACERMEEVYNQNVSEFRSRLKVVESLYQTAMDWIVDNPGARGLDEGLLMELQEKADLNAYVRERVFPRDRPDLVLAGTSPPTVRLFKVCSEIKTECEDLLEECCGIALVPKEANKNGPPVRIARQITMMSLHEADPATFPLVSLIEQDPVDGIVSFLAQPVDSQNVQLGESQSECTQLPENHRQVEDSNGPSAMIVGCNGRPSLLLATVQHATKYPTDWTDDGTKI